MTRLQISTVLLEFRISRLVGQSQRRPFAAFTMTLVVQGPQIITSMIVMSATRISSPAGLIQSPRGVANTSVRDVLPRWRRKHIAVMEETLKNGTKRNSIGVVTRRVLLVILSTARREKALHGPVAKRIGVVNIKRKAVLSNVLKVMSGQVGEKTGRSGAVPIRESHVRTINAQVIVQKAGLRKRRAGAVKTIKRVAVPMTVITCKTKWMTTGAMPREPIAVSKRRKVVQVTIPLRILIVQKTMETGRVNGLMPRKLGVATLIYVAVQCTSLKHRTEAVTIW